MGTQTNIRKFNSRDGAVQFTNDHITNLQPKEAHDLLISFNYEIDKLQNFVWGLGVGGWYFNIAKNQFCTEALIRAYLLKALLYATTLQEKG